MRGGAVMGIGEIAEAYGVSRSTAARCVKGCFGDAPKRGNSIQLDASQMQVFADYMEKRGKTVMRHNASDDEEMTRHDASTKDVEIAELRARVEGLERENELLHERLAVADEALAREQMASRGFWSRLGQKLLRDGKE